MKNNKQKRTKRKIKKKGRGCGSSKPTNPETVKVEIPAIAKTDSIRHSLTPSIRSSITPSKEQIKYLENKLNLVKQKRDVPIAHIRKLEELLEKIKEARETIDKGIERLEQIELEQIELEQRPRNRTSARGKRRKRKKTFKK